MNPWVKRSLAVALDEPLQAPPALRLGHGFQHGEPHAVTVAQPATEQDLDGLLQAVDQSSVGRAGERRGFRWTCAAAGGGGVVGKFLRTTASRRQPVRPSSALSFFLPAAVRPTSCQSADEIARHWVTALQAISKTRSNSVIPPGPTGCVDLHRVCGFQQLAGLGQQSEPRQTPGETPQHALDRAGGDDPLRDAAARRGPRKARAARPASAATSARPPASRRRRRATGPRGPRPPIAPTPRCPPAGDGRAIDARIIRAASPVSTHA